MLSRLLSLLVFLLLSFPTGGDAGCSPYFGHGAGTDHFTSNSSAPPCPTECSNPTFSKTLHTDRFKLGLSTHYDLTLLHHPLPTMAYQLVREAILAGGPVPALLMADGPFMSYRSGVYTHSCDMNPNHAVTAISLDLLEQLGPLLGRGWKVPCWTVRPDPCHHSHAEPPGQQHRLQLSISGQHRNPCSGAEPCRTLPQR